MITTNQVIEEVTSGPHQKTRVRETAVLVILPPPIPVCFSPSLYNRLHRSGFERARL
jgi:hypothetical protein